MTGHTVSLEEASVFYSKALTYSVKHHSLWAKDENMHSSLLHSCSPRR